MKRNSCRVALGQGRQPLGASGHPHAARSGLHPASSTFSTSSTCSTRTGALATSAARTARVSSTRRSIVATPGHATQLGDQAQGVFNYISTTQFNTRNASSNYAMQIQLKYAF